MLRKISFLALMALLSGCGTPTLYSWGHYEDLVYTMYAKPDKATPERQVRLLDEDLQKASSRHQPIPPGVHAHLGFLYYQLGQADNARQQFEAEKAQFPESGVFMDRMLANLGKK